MSLRSRLWGDWVLFLTMGFLSKSTGAWLELGADIPTKENLVVVWAKPRDSKPKIRIQSVLWVYALFNKETRGYILWWMWRKSKNSATFHTWEIIKCRTGSGIPKIALQIFPNSHIFSWIYVRRQGVLKRFFNFVVFFPKVGLLVCNKSRISGVYTGGSQLIQRKTPRKLFWIKQISN